MQTVRCFSRGCAVPKMSAWAWTMMLVIGCFWMNGRAEEKKTPAEGEKKPQVEWQKWSDKIFEQAKAEKKLVLLDLGASWCHWCHVMDELTYSDADVVKILKNGYIAVHVDQDSRPDISSRYEDYGWPATIVFKWDGSELAKRSGYIPP